MKRVSRRLLSVTMALALVFTSVLPSAAVSFSIPTQPMDTQDNVIKTTAARAGQVAPLILGCNLVASSNLGASQGDYNRVSSILGVFGSDINSSPDPYLYNYNYNLYATDNGLSTVANATISESQSEGTAATPEVIENMLTHRPDLILNQAGGIGSNSENANYANVIATLPENTDEDTTNDYTPSYYTCSISTLVYQCENLINLSNVVNSVCESKGLTTRYGDAYEIATNYDKYVWGYYFYVQKMLAEKNIAKKKVAVVSGTSDSGATWTLPAVGTSVSQSKPNRLVEYVRDNTDLLNTTTAGSAALADVMGCDVVVANGQGDALRSAAEAAGIDEDDLPLIIETLPTCLYGMIMQTHENALGIPYLQSIIYGEDLGLNPVYAAAYFYQNFFHITDEEALQETVSTLLSSATLPAGTTTSLTGYDPENVEDVISQGIQYALANGLKRHDDTEAWDPDMTTGIQALPATAHNYANNADQTWTYTAEDADNGVYVTFDANTSVESNYDFIYVLDADDNQIGKYTGTALAGQTLYIPTGTFKVRLTSDSSSVKWGFAVTDVEAAGELIDLEKVGSVDDIAPVYVGEDPSVTVRVNGEELDSDAYTVSCDTSAVGETTATITGTGSYEGTLTKAFNVVDDDNLLAGVTVTESNISLRQSGDTGSSYVGISGANSAWVAAVQSITFEPIEADGSATPEPADEIETPELPVDGSDAVVTPTFSKVYPKAPKTITLTKDDLTVTTSRVSFARTAEDPIVYVPEGHDPIDISSRWGSNTYPQSQKYKVTIKARGYEDSVGIVTYYTGTAPAFSIIVDEDGNTATTDDRTVVKSWTSDEIAEIAEFANGSSQCGMTGFRTFSGDGVSIEKLLELAETEVSDSDYFLLDTSDHYGNYFTYENLFGVDRYFLSTIYTDEFKAFYDELVSSDSSSGGIIALRRYLAEHATEADVVKPRINTGYVETMISGSALADAVLPTAENTICNELVAYENQFRFFYGIKLVQEDCTVTFDSQGGSEVDSQLVKSHLMTSTENTTMRSSYWANSLVIFRGAGEAYKTDPSSAADKLTRPADPSRVGYTFEGWYTDEECTEGNEFDFSSNDGTVDENTTLYAKWSEGATLPESEHDYTNYFDRTYTYDYGEEATNGIIVTFSEETSTEKGYDFITILDADGNELGKYSGTELAGKSIYVPTSKVQIHFTSDRSNVDYGFKVESIVPNGETIDLGEFGVIGKIDAVEVNGTPDITVTVNGEELTQDTDYTVAYDTSSAGVKTATVTGINNYSGTLTKDFVVYKDAVKITDFTITSKEHNDEDAELNQTIIATITFDKDVKMTAEDLSDELNITIAGGNVYSTARDVSFAVDGNQLIITMVSTGWVAIYNGVLSISESDNNLTHLTGTEEGSAVIWETQTDNIPIGIVVVNNPTAGTADAAASTAVEVTHKANMRGMYHFQLVSIVDGEETVVAQGTSHAHNFYSTITKETIAKAIATFVNNQEGYTAVYNEDTATFTMTADEAVEGQTIVIRMVENKATINIKSDMEAAAEVEELIDAIGEVTEDSGDAIKAARDAYDALTDAQKELVSDEAVAALEAAEAAYEEIMAAKADAEAAAAVEELIDAIGEVTEDSGDAIKAARDAYDALTDAQKELVSDEAVAALEAAEAAYAEIMAAKADAEAAAAVEEAINAIGTVTKDSADAIKAARDAYDALTDAQKALVSADAVKTLEDAEAALEALNKTKFIDVPEDSYYAAAVDWAVANNITKGTSETTFSPTNECTRGQMVTFLYRAAGSPTVTSTNNPFTDVKEGSYYYDAVLWAVENGITKGMTATTFEPDTKVSRGQAVTFLYRMDGEKAVSATNPFTDVSSSAFYYDAVLWAVDKGITNGITATTFEPGTACQRAHIVTFLYRYLG